VNITRIRLLVSGLRRQKKMYCALDSDLAKENHRAAELSRFSHSIEKGLAIDNPRLGFGHDKQKKMMQLIISLETSKSSYHKEVCLIALDTLKEYIEFHRSKSYSDEMCEEIESFLKTHWICHSGKYGGIKEVKKTDCLFDRLVIEDFFHSRHSIRDFSDQDVDDAVLIKALKLAQYAPSACNRQGVRAYVLNKEQSKEYAKRLEGVGGFADKATRLILITAKLSAYRQDESFQYIVSAGIYAAYLSLTLHTYGLAGCVIQRQVTWSKEWEDKRTSLGIPEDEQIILLFAVGNMKDKFNVPISHRLQNEEMIRFL